MRLVEEAGSVIHPSADRMEAHIARCPHRVRGQTFFGGEITMFTELANDSRNEAMNRLEQLARVMGANAVLDMRFPCG